MLLKKYFKYFVYVGATIILAYIVFSVYLTVTADVNCRIEQVMRVESADKSFTVFNYIEKCSDRDIIESLLYINEKRIGKNNLIYKVQSDEPVFIHVRFLSNENIEIYVPVISKIISEEKFAIDKKVSYFYLKVEG